MSGKVLDKNEVKRKGQAFKFIALGAAAVCFVILILALRNNPTYTSNEYKVSLEYPMGWKKAAGFTQRYEGKDGFFHIGGISGENLTIDEVTEKEATQRIKPYGSDPTVVGMIIDGQEARLILPSDDQTMVKNQAGLIVQYPKPVTIGDSTYHYFILWADKAHIQQIAETITFKD